MRCRVILYLTKNKIYYVRVRGVNDKVYGKWSKVKKAEFNSACHHEYVISSPGYLPRRNLTIFRFHQNIEFSVGSHCQFPVPLHPEFVNRL